MAPPKSFNPGGPMKPRRKSFAPGMLSTVDNAKPAPKPHPHMTGSDGRSYPTTVSAFGKNYRSIAGRPGTRSAHERQLGQVLRRLPTEQRKIYLQGQAQLGFGAKHSQAWINDWLKRHYKYIPKGGPPKKGKTFGGPGKGRRKTIAGSLGV